MASAREGIDLRPSGLYRARVWDPRAGRHVSKSFDTEKAAVRWRDLARGEVAKRKRIATPDQSFRAIAEAWLADLDAGRIRSARGDHQPLAAETAAKYRSSLERLVVPHFGAARVGAIERRHVQRFVDDLAHQGRSATDVKNALKPLAAIMRRLVDAGDLADSPTRGVHLAPARTRRDRIEDPDDVEMRVVTPVEAAALLGALPPHPRAVFAVAMLAGLRLGELRALAWDKVDLDAGELRVDWQLQGRAKKLPKGGLRRRVPIFDQLRGELEAWREASGRRTGLVLGSSARDAFTHTWIQKQADRAWRDAGLGRVTPHLARHVFESTLAAASVPRDDLMRWMGQRSEGVVLLYVHEMEGAQARARARVEEFLA